MAKYVAAACVVLLAFGVSTSAAAAEEIGIQVSPSTINLAYEGTVVTVHADIPYAKVAAVDASLTLNGVQVWYTKSDACGDLVAKFHVDDVKAILEDSVGGNATLTLSAVVVLETGEEDLFFWGEDAVRVVDNGGKK